MLMLVMITNTFAQELEFQATEPFIDSYAGQVQWVQLDAESNIKSALITGRNSNIDNFTEYSGSLKLFDYDVVTGQGTEVFDFDVYGGSGSFSVFYENDYVYIAFLGSIQAENVSYQGLRVWRALRDGNANFIEIFTDPSVFFNNTITDIDIDDDGNTDFLVGGASNFGFNSNRVLHNNGDGTFVMIAAPTVIPGANSGYYHSGYLDDTGRKHLVAAGVSGGQAFGYVYENQGNGVWVQVYDLGTNLFSAFPTIEIIDIDNDGLNDISVASLGGTKIYKNLGNLDFELYDNLVTGLPAVFQGVVKYADFNNDGLLDAVASGLNSGPTASGHIYFQSNEGPVGEPGSLEFVNPYQLMVPPFESPEFNPDIPLRMGQTDIDICDIDNDGDMDFIVNGSYGGGGAGLAAPRTYVFTNVTGELEDPVVETNPATNVDENSAVLNASVIVGQDLNVWFRYSTASDVSCSNGTFVNGPDTINENESFEQTITGLNDNTTYYCIACGEDTNGTVAQGIIQQFTTDEVTVDPMVETNPATNVDENSAVLNASVIAGQDLNVWFRYSTSSDVSCSNGTFVNGPDAVNENESFEQTITELIADTTYYCIACGEDTNGTVAQGIVQQFTTDEVMSVNDFDVASSLKMYPNPTRSILSVDSSLPIEKIHVYNMAGQIIQRFENVSNIDLGNYDAGIYLFRIYADNGSIAMKKIIKQ